MISWEARAEREKLVAASREEKARFPDGKPVELSRRDWEAAARLFVLPAGARFERIDVAGMAAEWMDMPQVNRERTVLLLHGGGYNSGSPRTARMLAAMLGRTANMRVLVPDYRLAPEHPFPAGVMDALKAYGFLLQQGYEARNIVFAGDSAGGGLALSALLALRRAGTRLPRAALLLSAWTDLSASGASYENNRDPTITREGMLRAARWYAGRHDLKEPLASPLFADLRGLPPLLIHAGEDEALFDDSRLLAERAKAAHVAVTYKAYEGMWHVFHAWAPGVPEAAQAMTDIAAFIRAQFGD